MSRIHLMYNSAYQQPYTFWKVSHTGTLEENITKDVLELSKEEFSMYILTALLENENDCLSEKQCYRIAEWLDQYFEIRLRKQRKF